MNVPATEAAPDDPSGLPARAGNVTRAVGAIGANVSR
jgi:hypothetical protein